MKFGNAIKMCRVRKNLKQSELAELSGISTSYLSLLEQNKRDPNISTITSIAKALQIPMSILTFLATEPDELSEINKELAEKLSLTALQLIGGASNEFA
jgi:transcriptional regulator with XRE-family HTH domain